MKYAIIYADPPWEYRRNKGQGVAENHYHTMPLADICALPVPVIAEKDSVLFLWTTFPQLPEALKVMSAWTFTYKTVAFVWVKQNKSGQGFFSDSGTGHALTQKSVCLV